MRNKYRQTQSHLSEKSYVRSLTAATLEPGFEMRLTLNVFDLSSAPLLLCRVSAEVIEIPYILCIE